MVAGFLYSRGRSDGRFHFYAGAIFNKYQDYLVRGLYSDEAFLWFCDCFSNVGEIRCASSLLGSSVKDVCWYEGGC